MKQKNQKNKSETGPLNFPSEVQVSLLPMLQEFCQEVSNSERTQQAQGSGGGSEGEGIPGQ